MFTASKSMRTLQPPLKSLHHAKFISISRYQAKKKKLFHDHDSYFFLYKKKCLKDIRDKSWSAFLRVENVALCFHLD